ncbi:antibiotic biosynthesis monooxygenase [Mucilaginibacter sp. BT774]|uniref:antibiotic biosynthesis monooxygenase n=1 Tax=Mucilaginibacter sp. BT774 TaxID=3062276 RepID=UPI0026767552|nr:antibiotic biosynthesis monooxygenase [Mucilaginibacter sp. BT774]MDO3624995.1 antibiotic biosynthesis monooxygenase [Mucilaginibacter sp. BT774]
MERVIVQFSIPGMTSKVYDQVWDELRKAGHSHPAGLHYHVGAQQDNNWLVIDVWESLEAFNKFGETLMPILTKAGVNPDSSKPVITPVYYEYDAALVH